MIWEAKFIDREKELKLLKYSLEQAQTGFGGILFITGEAGVGKSRLLEELVALAREKLVFVEKRHNLGAATLLDVQVAAQQLAVAQAKKEKIIVSQRLILQDMRFFMGLKSSDALNIDYRDASRQVLGGFQPNSATLGQVRSNSLSLKIQDLCHLPLELVCTQMIPDKRDFSL